MPLGAAGKGANRHHGWHIGHAADHCDAGSARHERAAGTGGPGTMSEIFDLGAAAPYLGLLARVSLIAMFVMLVTVLAERLGPFLGAMVASLPLYTGPTYLMLALEHDVPYLLAATVGSIAICGATPVFALAYCVLSRSWGMWVSLFGSLAAWTACAVIVQSNQWSLVEALLFVTPIYIVSVALARGYTRGIAMRRAERRWTDLPTRALMVASAAGATIAISKFVPPQLTGVLSVLPVIMSSLIVILHPRIGGPAAAALFAHTLGGLVGMVLAFVLINLTIERVGPAVALSGGLAVTLIWNLLLIAVRRFTHPPADASAAQHQPRRKGPQAPLPRRPAGTMGHALPPPLGPGPAARPRPPAGARPLPPQRSKVR